MKKELKKFVENFAKKVEKLDLKPFLQKGNRIATNSAQQISELKHEMMRHEEQGQENVISALAGAAFFRIATRAFILAEIVKRLEQQRDVEKLTDRLEEINKNEELFDKILDDYKFMDKEQLADMVLDTDKTLTEIRSEQQELLTNLQASKEAIEPTVEGHSDYSKAAHLLLEFDTAYGLDETNAKIALAYANDAYGADLNARDVANIAVVNNAIVNGEKEFDFGAEIDRPKLEMAASEAMSCRTPEVGGLEI